MSLGFSRRGQRRGPRSEKRRCSLCRMREELPGKLVVGPGVYICSACVARTVKALDHS